MEKLNIRYPYQLIYNHKSNDKDKLIFFETLISHAYNYNPNFKKLDKTEVKNNMLFILNEIKKRYFKTTPEEIISTISGMRFWTRIDLPLSFSFDHVGHISLYQKRIETLQKIKSSNSLFLDDIPHNSHDLSCESPVVIKGNLYKSSESKISVEQKFISQNKKDIFESI